MRMYTEFRLRCTYVGLYNDVMAPRRINGGARRCRVLERPVKCLQTLSLQFSKSMDDYKLILSAWNPEASSARSQGKPLF